MLLLTSVLHTHAVMKEEAGLLPRFWSFVVVVVVTVVLAALLRLGLGD